MRNSNSYSLLIILLLITLTACAPKGDKQKAEDEYQAIRLMESSSSIDELVSTGNRYFKAHRLDIAEEHYKKALEREYELPQVHFNLGLIYDQTYRFTLAIREYSIAINQKEGYIKAHMNLGLVLAKTQDFEKGLKHIDWVLSQEPENLRALYNRALVLHKSHDAGATEAWKLYIDHARGQPAHIGNVNRAITYLRILESTKE